MKKSLIVVAFVFCIAFWGRQSATFAHDDQKPIHLSAVVLVENSQWKSKATGPHPIHYGEHGFPHRFQNDSNFELSIKYVGSLDGADIYLVKYSASLKDDVVVEETEKAIVYRGKAVEFYRDDALVISILPEQAD